MYRSLLRDIRNSLQRLSPAERSILAAIMPMGELQDRESEAEQQTQVSNLWQLLKGQFGDSITVRLGRSFRPELNIAFVLSSAGHTLANGCIRLSKLWHLYCGCSSLYAEQRGDGFIIGLDSLKEYPGVECTLLFRLSSILAWMRWLSGLDITPTQALFACVPPDETTLFEHHFTSSMQFGMNVNELRFGREVAEIPLPGGDEDLITRLEAYAEELIQVRQSGTDPLLRLRSAIRRNLDSDTGIKTIAPQMDMSVRSLQRQLNSAGLTFSDILEDVRMEAAYRYLLTSGLSIREIGRRIGYSDAANFVRAFRRHTGTTPDRYRRNAGPQAP
jgi:AraC-like DNA-binding protein